MGKINEELKRKITFTKEVINFDGKPGVKISTTYKGIYRQYMYIDYEGTDDGQLCKPFIETEQQKEIFAQNIITHAVEKALIEKGVEI